MEQKDYGSDRLDTDVNRIIGAACPVIATEADVAGVFEFVFCILGGSDHRRPSEFKFRTWQWTLCCCARNCAGVVTRCNLRRLLVQSLGNSLRPRFAQREKEID